MAKEVASGSVKDSVPSTTSSTETSAGESSTTTSATEKVSGSVLPTGASDASKDATEVLVEGAKTEKKSEERTPDDELRQGESSSSSLTEGVGGRDANEEANDGESLSLSSYRIQETPNQLSSTTSKR